eukprot:tig00020920_g15914.t1
MSSAGYEDAWGHGDRPRYKDERDAGSEASTSQPAPFQMRMSAMLPSYGWGGYPSTSGPGTSEPRGSDRSGGLGAGASSGAVEPHASGPSGFASGAASAYGGPPNGTQPAYGGSAAGGGSGGNSGQGATAGGPSYGNVSAHSMFLHPSAAPSGSGGAPWGPTGFGGQGPGEGHGGSGSQWRDPFAPRPPEGPDGPQGATAGHGSTAGYGAPYGPHGGPAAPHGGPWAAGGRNGVRVAPAWQGAGGGAHSAYTIPAATSAGGGALVSHYSHARDAAGSYYAAPGSGAASGDRRPGFEEQAGPSGPASTTASRAAGASRTRRALVPASRENTLSAQLLSFLSESGAGEGKRGRWPGSIERTQLFALPIVEAAQALSVSVSTLKPQRKIAGLKRWESAAQLALERVQAAQAGQRPGGHVAAGLARLVRLPTPPRPAAPGSGPGRRRRQHLRGGRARQSDELRGVLEALQEALTSVLADPSRGGFRGGRGGAARFVFGD